MSKNLDKKITVSLGCTDFLVSEVETLRKQNDLLSVQVSVMNSFFGMVDRLGGKPSQGFVEDRLWQAKKEIQIATESVYTV